MNDKEYAEELEKIVIFMCDVYSKYQDSIAVQTDDKGQTDDGWFNVYMSLPTIQGSMARIYVDRIGKLRDKRHNREAPKINFQQLYEILSKKRNDTSRS